MDYRTREMPPAAATPPPSSQPHFPEMIIAAIKALKKSSKNDRTHIGHYIYHMYKDLPTNRRRMLTWHLNKMTEEGYLERDNQFYVLSATGPRSKPVGLVSGPPKRKRGRPAKAKTNVGPNGGPVEKTKKRRSLSGKPLGRPRKIVLSPTVQENGPSKVGRSGEYGHVSSTPTTTGCLELKRSYHGVLEE